MVITQKLVPSTMDDQSIGNCIHKQTHGLFILELEPTHSDLPTPNT